MSNRLTKITTRTGDDGTTGLGDGSRVSKACPRIHALGEIDELNCAIGVLLTVPLPAEISALMVEVQHDLFDLGGELCIPGYTLLDASRIVALDEALTRHNASLPPLKDFILPGGAPAAAYAHVARAICRRVERAVVVLAQSEAVGTTPRQYLNRLSDLLFVLSRVLNRVNGEDDVLWKHREKR